MQAHCSTIIMVLKFLFDKAEDEEEVFAAADMIDFIEKHSCLSLETLLSLVNSEEIDWAPGPITGLKFLYYALDYFLVYGGNPDEHIKIYPLLESIKSYIDNKPNLKE